MIDSKEGSKIVWNLAMKHLVDKQANLELNPVLNGQNVSFLKVNIKVFSAAINLIDKLDEFK